MALQVFNPSPHQNRKGLDSPWQQDGAFFSQDRPQARFRPPGQHRKHPPGRLIAAPCPISRLLRTAPTGPPIPAYATALRFALMGFNRQRLAALGRWLYDNDGWVALAVDQIANYSAPITPMSATLNPDWKQARGYLLF